MKLMDLAATRLFLFHMAESPDRLDFKYMDSPAIGGPKWCKM